MKKMTTRTILLEEKDTNLSRKIVLWQQVQRLYMPGLRVDLPPSDAPPDGDNAAAVPAVDLRIALPSSVPVEQRQSVCVEGLADKELRLRLAQANDALAALRRHLRVGARIFKTRMTQTSGEGQKINTRMNAFQARYEEKALHDAERYRAARRALLSLDPGGSWMGRLKELSAADVRPPNRTQDDESEGRRTLAWIWTATRDDLEVEDGK